MLYTNIHTHQYYNEGLEIFNQYPHDLKKITGYYSIGIHPWYIKEERVTHYLALIEEHLCDDRCLAIGECGLDKNIEIDFSLQQEVFKQQLQLAETYSKPIIIHCVKAFNELMSLSRSVIVPMIVHGYSKNQQLGEQLIQKGFYLSLGINIQEKRELRELLKAQYDKILFETDDRKESIRKVFETAAEVLSKSVEQVKEEQYHKVKRIFNVR